MAPKRKSPEAAAAAPAPAKSAAKSSSAPDVAPPAAKKAKAAAAPKAAAPAATATAAAAPAASSDAAATAADVHIVSSKVCQAFKKRSDQVVSAVKKAFPSAKVVVDERPAEGRKPDRGSFVVTARGKEVAAFRAMPRPFSAMKAADIEGDVVARVVAALKA